MYFNNYNNMNNENMNNEGYNMDNTNKKENMKETMIVYASMVEAIRCLTTAEERCAAYDLMFDYGIWNLYPEIERLSPVLQMFIKQAMPNIDANDKRYQKACSNGKNGGRPTKYSKTDIIKLYEDEFTVEEIAKEFGCSEKTVRRAISSSK